MDEGVLVSLKILLLFPFGKRSLNKKVDEITKTSQKNYSILNFIKDHHLRKYVERFY